MADISSTQLLGRIGGEPEFRTTQGGKDLAIFSLATDTGWFDRESGEWRKNLNWHRIVVYPPGLVERVRQRGKKGVRVIVDGEINYHTYRKDGEQADRRETEIHVKGDGGLNFIDSDKAD